MPIREFHCPRCGYQVEIIEPLDEPPETCDKCTGNMVRLISKTGGRWRYADTKGESDATRSD
jgi:putative FmdB family regulatory protein